MIEINLLPKQYQKTGVSLSFGKTGLYVIAVIGGVVLMLAGITLYQLNQISTLDDNITKAHQRAAMLQKDIQLVDGLIDVKKKINDRMTAVERLDGHRSSWVRILQNLSGNVPEFVWLARFTEKSPEIPKDTSAQTSEPNLALLLVRPVEVEGYTFTLNALASFMINMMRSDYFDNVELSSTSEKTFGEQKAYNFVVSCDLHNLSDDDLRDLIAKTEKSENNNEKTPIRQKSLN